ncbi:DUF6097 family protein [Pedobacter sp. L105]|uniref:DUF6097 family protein n=1 Tax=Pedobacter sp. L105 TaxID=1641871 RepID=UPI00352B9391
MGQSFHYILKSARWLVFIAGVGLSQLLIIFLFKFLDTQKLDIHDFIFNGFFLFLCVSSVSSICYEFYAENNIPINKSVNDWLFIFSVLIILSSMIIYSNIYFKHLDVNYKSQHLPNNIQNAYVLTHTILVGCSAIIALVLKSIVYYHHDKVSENGK